jgi:hypothetical protein
MTQTTIKGFSVRVAMMLLVMMLTTVTAWAQDKTLSGSESYTAQDGDVLTGSTSGTVTIANGANVTLSDVTITGGIVCAGTAEITLVGTNSVTGASYKAGIQVGGSGTTLTINGDGSLTANGGNQSAGIGLSCAWDPANNVIGGDIVIEGGNITANGGSQWGAGIGTGVIYGNGSAKTARIGDITIKGGSVKATGGSEANGIGTGYTYGGCTNTIGTVTIYVGIDKVDASSIRDFGSVVYKHDETDVTANKSDYFTITEDGNRRVIEPKDDTDYTITIANGIEHGTLEGAATAKYTEKVTITATPDFGYRLSRLVVKDAQNNDVASTGNSFFMPKSNVTVSAVFEQGTHGTTEFAWGYIESGVFVTEATIYDGVTTVNLQQGKEYYIGKDYYEVEPGIGDYENTFRLDEDPGTFGRDIPYSGGTGSFMMGGFGKFRLNGDAGFYDITMTDVGNGKWSVSILKTVAVMDAVPDQTYTGSAITPEPLVIAGSLSLTKGTDYEYSYTNNTNVGTATVTVTFQGDYASLGSVEKEFTIVWSETDTDEYTIHNAAEWNVFCDCLNDNDTYNRFSGKTVRLGDDITVTRMAGSGDNPFCGNFDGGGNTLTFTATAADNYCAPFRNVKGGSDEDHAITISNLNVKTTITATDYRHAAGLIALQWGHVNVSGINATVNISSTVGTSNPHDLYPAALVSQASSSNGGTLTVTGCTATGTISTDGKYAAGLVGIVQGTASISDCISSVTINSSIKGDGTHGGIVAVVTGSGTITGCVFNGKLLTVNTGETATGNCAGFVAWGNGTISNCLYAPAAIEGDEAEVVAGTGDYPSGTFYRGTAPTVTNCYYTRLLGNAQGKAPLAVTAGDNVIIEAISPVGEPTSTDGYNGLYSVSGITAYAKGITRTVEETTTFYYGQGDDVSLTLTSSAPVGYACVYTPTSGSISGSDNPYTLRMPNRDVTISRSLRSTGKTVDVSYMLADGTPQTAQAIALDGTETSHGQSNQEKWYFVGTDISHAQPLTLYGNVHLILADGCNMSVTTTDDYCIYADGHSLHIYGQTEGTGILNARTQGRYSVIGIFDGILGIHGGNVTATVGGTSNAIYVEETTDGYALIIDRGTLTATASSGANSGAGICISGGNACINGGQVEATGGNGGIDVMDYSTAIPGTLTLGGGTLKVSRFNMNSGYSYAGTLAVADGYTYTDGTTLYNSATPSATLAALTNVTLQPCAVATFAPAGFCTYYHSKFDVKLPEGVKARIVTSKGSAEGTLTYETIADGDTDNNKVVPAGTAVMLQTEKSTEAQQKTLTLAAHGANSPAAPTLNLLHGSDVEGTTTGDGKHYKLTYGNDNTPNADVFGWYWGAADGAAFTQAGHKAWLVLPADAYARSFFGLPDDDTTSIIENGKLKIENSNSDAWYDLSGRKLDNGQRSMVNGQWSKVNGQWSKGIYIRGGKKIVIK